MGDAGLDLKLQQVEHDDGRRFAPGAGGGRESDVRLERAWHRLPLADRLVDVVYQLARVSGEEVHRLSGIDGAAAAERDERFGLGLASVGDRLVDRSVGRLHMDVIVDVELHPSVADDPLQLLDQAELPQIAIGHEESAAHAEPVQLVPELLRGAEPETDGHTVERDDSLGRDQAVARHGASPFLPAAPAWPLDARGRPSAE